MQSHSVNAQSTIKWMVKWGSMVHFAVHIFLPQLRMLLDISSLSSARLLAFNPLTSSGQVTNGLVSHNIWNQSWLKGP